MLSLSSELILGKKNIKHTVHTLRILRYPLHNRGGQQANGRGDCPLSPPQETAGGIRRYLR